jgi:hypothetical protein
MPCDLSNCCGVAAKEIGRIILLIVVFGPTITAQYIIGGCMKALALLPSTIFN